MGTLSAAYSYGTSRANPDNLAVVARIYQRNRMPSARQLRDLGDRKLALLGQTVKRSLFWNDISIKEFADILQTVVDRVAQKTSQPPVIIEVAAGYGDLSLGLRQYFSNLIIPTDSYCETFNYNQRIMAQRGVIKLTAEEIVASNIRERLGIPESAGLILIGALLPKKAGVEEALLNQRICDELIFVHCRKTFKTSGDEGIVPNRQVWDWQIKRTNPDHWFCEAVVDEGEKSKRFDLEVHMMSRKSQDTYLDLPGAISINELPKEEYLLTQGKVSGDSFVGWLYSQIGWGINISIFKSILRKTIFASGQPFERQKATVASLLDLFVDNSRGVQRDDFDSMRLAFIRYLNGGAHAI
jgi:hypothetical protein